MKRLTVGEVLEAYEKTKIKPISGEFYNCNNCGCAMGAYALHQGQLKDECPNDEFFAQFNWGYMSGFYTGFDGKEYDLDVDDFNLLDVEDSNYIKNYRFGHEDGVSAREQEKQLSSSMVSLNENYYRYR